MKQALEIDLLCFSCIQDILGTKLKRHQPQQHHYHGDILR